MRVVSLAPNSQPNGITTGPDGALWFTEYTTNNVGGITTAGGVTEPPGALWFTENGGNKIGPGRTAPFGSPSNPRERSDELLRAV
jgi:streptogramin lyase